MNADDIETFSSGAVVNFQRSNGSIVFRQQCCVCQDSGPLEGGADDQSITYERSGTVVTHDCAPAWMSGNQGCEGTVTWGRFPRGCEGSVTHSRLLDKGGGR